MTYQKLWDESDRSALLMIFILMGIRGILTRVYFMGYTSQDNKYRMIILC